jgi:hypothetical protein
MLGRAGFGFPHEQGRRQGGHRRRLTTSVAYRHRRRRCVLQKLRHVDLMGRVLPVELDANLLAFAVGDATSSAPSAATVVIVYFIRVSNHVAVQASCYVPGLTSRVDPLGLAIYAVSTTKCVIHLIRVLSNIANRHTQGHQPDQDSDWRQIDAQYEHDADCVGDVVGLLSGNHVSRWVPDRARCWEHELPADHPAAPPVGGDPNDLLVLGTDDTLSADPNDKG